MLDKIIEKLWKSLLVLFLVLGNVLIVSMIIIGLSMLLHAIGVW